MKTITKIDIGIVAIVVGVLAAVLFKMSLAPAPRLAVALHESQLHLSLVKASVSEATLFCDLASKKVGATFRFLSVEGKEPVTVVGDVNCPNSGDLVSWRESKVEAREDFDPAMVRVQLEQLFAKANIAASMEGRNLELGSHLDKRYHDLAQKTHLKKVAFNCDTAGERFKYAASYEGGQKSGQVKARCASNHESFVVAAASDRDQEGVSSPAYVEQSDGLDELTAEQAYREVLAQLSDERALASSSSTKAPASGSHKASAKAAAAGKEGAGRAKRRGAHSDSPTHQHEGAYPTCPTTHPPSPLVPRFVSS